MVHGSTVGLIAEGCIGAYLAMGKVKSVEHALSWSLNSNQLPLPLPLQRYHFLMFLLMYKKYI